MANIILARDVQWITDTSRASFAIEGISVKNIDYLSIWNGHPQSRVLLSECSALFFLSEPHSELEN